MGTARGVDASSSSTMRCLIIEDDVLVAQMLRDLLEGRGHQVLLAATGEEGLRAVMEDMPDAVFVDVVLPKLSGLGFLERLKQLGRWLPVVVMSGRATDEEARAGLQLGAMDYLPKPVRLSQLELILQVLEAGRFHGGDRIRLAFD